MKNLWKNKRAIGLSYRKLVVLIIIFIVILLVSINLSKNLILTKTSISQLEEEQCKTAPESFTLGSYYNCDLNEDCSEEEKKKWGEKRKEFEEKLNGKDCEKLKSDEEKKCSCVEQEIWNALHEKDRSSIENKIPFSKKSFSEPKYGVISLKVFLFELGGKKVNLIVEPGESFEFVHNRIWPLSDIRRKFIYTKEGKIQEILEGGFRNYYDEDFLDILTDTQGILEGGKKIDKIEIKNDKEEIKKTIDVPGMTFFIKARILASEGKINGFLKKRSQKCENKKISELSEEFKTKVRNIAEEVGTTEENLLRVIAFESGNTFCACKVNSIGAVGLIQFLPTTAEDLGTTTTELCEMGEMKQLDYVRDYLNKQRKGKELSTLNDLYMAILWPKAINKDEKTILFTRGSETYERNSGLDINKDGRITITEATKKVEENTKHLFS